MKLKLHKVLDNAHFESIRSNNLTLRQSALALLAKREGDAQTCLRHLFSGALSNGAIAVIVGRSDEEASEEFHRSAEYALALLRLTEGGKPLRSYEADLEVSPGGGVRTLALHERVPDPRERNLTIGDYGEALLAIVAFGEWPAIREAAQYPEERYRNPGLIVGEDFFVCIRAYKAWLLGEEAEAKKLAASVLDVSPPAIKPEVAAFLSMATGDQVGFAKHLEERLKAHKKQVSKQPNMPLGVICLPALMLCRMAHEKGIVVEETAYLPLRFVPGYSTAPTSVLH